MFTPKARVVSTCCWRVYHHHGDFIMPKTPQGNKLLQGWFQIGQLWEGFRPPSSCSCAQNLDSGDINMSNPRCSWDSSGPNFVLIGFPSLHLFWKNLESFLGLLKWVALWRLHRNDNCPVWPEITLEKSCKISQVNFIYLPGMLLSRHVASLVSLNWAKHHLQTQASSTLKNTENQYTIDALA